MALHFFLGANSGAGFVSLYSPLAAEGSRRVYAVKSGPGCGKSTCIRRLAEALGGPEEWIHCSSDPDSLDGAVFPDLALLDGTAPHLFDPAFPGADGGYLSMPPFLHEEALAGKREALLALKAASAAEYASAYRLLAAVKQLRAEQRALLQALLPFDYLEKKARSLLKKEGLTGAAPKRGRVRLRFLDGYTPKGALFLGETAVECAQRAIVLKDSCGLALPLLEALRDQAAAGGETVYACLDPLEPERTIHLLLPGRGLAILTDDGRRSLPPLPGRTLHPENALPREELRARRGRLRLLRKSEASLLAEITGHLAAAHAFHDQIEALYRPHLDFDAIDDLYEAQLKSILAGRER